MRKIVYNFFIFIFIISGSLLGQKPEIKFTFTAQCIMQNQTYNLILDSVRITNLTQECGDTILYNPDTMLVLKYTIVGIENDLLIKDFRIFLNTPIPFWDDCYITIETSEAGKLNIEVFNLMGEKVLKNEYGVAVGKHSFQFISGREKYYILVAKFNGMTEAIKILGKNNKNHNSTIFYKGTSESSGGYKKVKDEIFFKYSFGDKIRFIGYAQNQLGIAGYDIIEEIPLESKNYNFNIIEGLPCPGIGLVIYGGKTYGTVQIGNQCWFKENLNIGYKIYGEYNQSNNNVIEKYCYDDVSQNCETYGGLYQWDEMMQYTSTPGTQGICPEGWHIPTDIEWCDLTTFIDQTVNCNVIGWSGTDCGTKMKTTSGWNIFNEGTNESGFSALPGGIRGNNGYFFAEGNSGSFYASKKIDPYTVIERGVNYEEEKMIRYTLIKYIGCSVRCIKN